MNAPLWGLHVWLQPIYFYIISVIILETFQLELNFELYFQYELSFHPAAKPKPNLPDLSPFLFDKQRLATIFFLLVTAPD